MNYFSRDELKCPCCDECNMDQAFMDCINALRHEYGYPIICKAPDGSAYRCPAHNLAVGGKEHSFHLLGRAMDIAAPTVKMRMKIMELARKHKLLGVGLGHNFVHLDNRDKPTFWVYK